MYINKKFFNTIKPILNRLEDKIGNDFIVFGSAPLYLIGIVDFNKNINDLDVAIKEKNKIPKEANEVTFQGDPNQKLYKLKINNIEVDIGTCWPGQENYFYKLFNNHIVVDGFKFANLDVCEEWKERMVKKYNREKDKKYLIKIKKYRAKQKDE
ncbi:hypothetical protein C0583_04300 [Candidatus Parcubacteria bacterium]|nr:MAG: hypothetical protein C0583_04300 [Candidatus Parcubacteria bacterium]